MRREESRLGGRKIENIWSRIDDYWEVLMRKEKY